jgi:hypothetical protein
MNQPIVSVYRIALGRSAGIDTVLCIGCASREPRLLGQVQAAPERYCVRCGLQGRDARAVHAGSLPDLATALAAARVQVANQPQWLTDCNDAGAWLEAHPNPLITDGHVVLIPSESQPTVFYSVNGTCQCAAHSFRATSRKDRACKHRVRARLLIRALAAGDEPTQAPTYRTLRSSTQELITPTAQLDLARSAAELEARYQQSLAEVNELFPD